MCTHENGAPVLSPGKRLETLIVKADNEPGVWEFYSCIAVACSLTRRWLLAVYPRLYLTALTFSMPGAGADGTTEELTMYKLGVAYADNTREVSSQVIKHFGWCADHSRCMHTPRALMRWYVGTSRTSATSVSSRLMGLRWFLVMCSAC